MHYLDTETDEAYEIFFEKNEFNVGKPFSTETDRIHLRSDSSMKEIYDVLGRQPCPNELAYWGFRKLFFTFFVN